MRKIYLKYFALIFSVLILLQETHGKYNSIYHFKQRNKKGSLYNDEKDFENDRSVSSVVKILPELKPPELKPPDSKPPDFSDEHNARSNQKKSLGVALLGVSLISAGLDIYKQEAGCDHIAPKLKSNFEKINQLQTQLRADSKQINLDWNPIVSSENYFSRLNGQMLLLQNQAARLDILRYDIVTLLDTNIVSKIDLTTRQLKNEIDAFNMTTDLSDPSFLVARFYAQSQYALMVSAKLLPIGFWMGNKAFGPSISKWFSKHMSERFAKNNPGRIAKMIKHYQTSGGFFSNTRAKFSKWLKNKPSYKYMKIKLTLSAANKARWTTAKKWISGFGKSAIVGLFLAYEVFNMYKFVKECEKKEKKSEEMISTLQESRKNVTILRSNMTVLKTKIEGNYTIILQELQRYKFHQYVIEVQNTSSNAQHQNETNTLAESGLQSFLDGINSTIINGDIKYAKVTQLVDQLLDAFRNVSYSLDCYQRKLSVIVQITDDCAAGHSTYQQLWEKVKKLEGSVLKKCIVNEKYLSKSEVKGIVRSLMVVRKKSKICIRNNKGKLDRVCGNWLSGMSNVDNKDNVGQVTLDDIQYFIKLCPPSDTTPAIKTSTCTKKSEGTSLREVKILFYKFNFNQIESVYTGCQLSSIQKSIICSRRESGYNVTYCQKKYNLYKAGYVSAIYKACNLVINPSNGATICFYSKMGKTTDANHGFFGRYRKIYGVEKVQAYIDKKCTPPAGDEQLINGVFLLDKKLSD